MNNAINALIFLVATLFLVTTAWASTPVAPQAAEDITAAKPAPKRFTLPQAAGKTKVGAETTVKVKVKVAKGWKWNEQYPAKLEFTDVPAGVSLPKVKFNQLKGDFKSSKEQATVGLQISGKKTGKATLVGKMKFSVCNETSCVIEKSPVNVIVSVL